MFKLVIQDDEGKTTVVPLIRDEITIGRKEGNTIRLTERNVSRRHARIVRSNGAVAIEDLGSYNGVRVNGTRIAQRTSLSVSDRVQIGDYLIELKAEGVEQASDDGKTQPIERMDPNYIEAQIGTAATMPPAPAGAAGVPPPTPVVALADTDPAARAIAAMPLAPIGQTSGHARLVVLSSNFAGQEWELSRPQMIIGRTDDNDLVVNHRSISRNHAKFVREPDTGRYTISDLQSSNGVRVNGEEYGKVELRRGDVIDLGHVRLRFVEPGEDFVFGRDAQIADVPTGGKNKTLMIAAAVVLLGVGGVAIFMLTRGDDKGGKKPDGEGSDSPLVATADAAPGPMITPDATAVEPETDFAKQLAACRDLRTSEDWMKVLTCANEMLKDSPTNQDLKDLADQAKREATNKLNADTLSTALAKGQYQEAIKALGKIPADSVYWERSKAAHDKVRDDYTAKEVATAQAKADRRDCKWIEARRKQLYWAETKQAFDKIECDKGGGTTVATPDPECRKDSDCKGSEECKSQKCVAKPSTSTDDCPQADFDNFMNEAREAGKANQWSKMLSRAESANKCIPTKAARQLALMAACRLGNRDKAARYWKEFENNSQMIQTCIGVVKD
jgi:ABC transport system ATP-binding/permease protein